MVPILVRVKTFHALDRAATLLVCSRDQGKITLRKLMQQMIRLSVEFPTSIPLMYVNKFVLSG
jgi:hypothetical protein